MRSAPLLSFRNDESPCRFEIISDYSRSSNNCLRERLTPGTSCSSSSSDNFNPACFAIVRNCANVIPSTIQFPHPPGYCCIGNKPLLVKYRSACQCNSYWNLWHLFSGTAPHNCLGRMEDGNGRDG